MNSASHSISRRQFLKSAALASGSLLTARSWSQVSGANGAIRVAVVGFGGRGGSHISAFSKMKGVRLVALCDVDQQVLDGMVKKMSQQTKGEIKGFRDIRQLLDSKEVDVISIATPNHWHSLGTIWAVQTGRDVYVEKPVSHNVWEGRQCVVAARKHQKIVQTGTQCRSSRVGIGEAVQWVAQGNLGKITLARGLCYKRRPSIGKVEGDQPIPPGIDYDLWCGPAEKLPLRRKKLHYDWHWVWNTGNGDLGNQGIHQMDICRWFLGEAALAPRVLSAGGRLGYVDDGETANTQIIYQDYAKAPLLFEVRGLETDKFMGAKVGCVIHCEGGHVVVPSYNDAIAYDKSGKEIKKWSGSEDHFANFIQAVQSRKHEDLHADILEGHLSSALCHTGNISHRLGKQQSPEEIQAAVKQDHDMGETFGRMLEHLEQNKVDAATDRITLGAALRMDPKTERFIGNEAANAMLTRKYREPFVIQPGS
ncbi:MAG: Gfo/Idh/MocA family oxidoreductase [Verrucomicrobiales bacterium]|nr:Gfo/Idh/MocA family oxidoreductase [Verrucomicrobiales bacterium]